MATKDSDSESSTSSSDNDSNSGSDSGSGSKSESDSENDLTEAEISKIINASKQKGITTSNMLEKVLLPHQLEKLKSEDKYLAQDDKSSVSDQISQEAECDEDKNVPLEKWCAPRLDKSVKSSIYDSSILYPEFDKFSLPSSTACLIQASVSSEYKGFPPVFSVESLAMTADTLSKDWDSICRTFMVEFAQDDKSSVSDQISQEAECDEDKNVPLEKWCAPRLDKSVKSSIYDSSILYPEFDKFSLPSSTACLIQASVSSEYKGFPPVFSVESLAMTADTLSKDWDSICRTFMVEFVLWDQPIPHFYDDDSNRNTNVPNSTMNVLHIESQSLDNVSAEVAQPNKQIKIKRSKPSRISNPPVIAKDSTEKTGGKPLYSEDTLACIRHAVEEGKENLSNSGYKIDES
ncbi:15516_t:CDS:10 [Entrophospora sp. SA101]|nr:15516_t:CDS:10 [Entrophospora sp. SA101]